MTLPSDSVVKRVLEFLIQQKRASPASMVEVKTLLARCTISDAEFHSLASHLAGLAFNYQGMDRLHISDSVLAYEQRLPFCTLSDALQFFRGIQAAKRRRQMMPTFAALARAANTPSVTLKAVLHFGGKVDDGKLVEAVALPWFEIMKMIKRDPSSIYQIDPFTWEEIIAGAYTRAGFDEVIVTPRSDDKGRDVIATRHGIGSVRFFDQVKAYRPGHLVTAEEVRAMVGTITAAQNVSKGIITTTSQFAPKIVTADFVKAMIPYRLELKGRDDLLAWLDGLSGPDHADGSSEGGT